MLLLAISFAIAALGCATWYWFALRYTRRRATEVARWIESALSGYGHITGIRWVSASRFQVPLRLSHAFRRASVFVDITPCEFPLVWAISRIRARREVLTFQADLELPPAFSLHVQNCRWFARSGRKMPKSDRGWIFEQNMPIVISTRSDWQREITCAIGTVAQGQTHDFLSIDFQRRSPHFSVTLPLDSIAPGSRTRSCLFESMRELASNSSASLF
jgi:hypothetical protein